MGTIHQAIASISTGISVFGTLVVLWGILEAAVSFLKGLLLREGMARVRHNMATRQNLGSHLLLGLEVFIAADIISSVASPSWERVGILGAIVAIRTVLSFFLMREFEKGAAVLKEPAPG